MKTTSKLDFGLATRRLETFRPQVELLEGRVQPGSILSGALNAALADGLGLFGAGALASLGAVEGLTPIHHEAVLSVNHSDETLAPAPGIANPVVHQQAIQSVSADLGSDVPIVGMLKGASMKGNSSGGGHVSTPGAELVQNGGFETGGFDGWTLDHSDIDVSVERGNANSGIYAAQLGPFNPDSLSQVLTTDVGQNYIFSFYLFNTSSAHNSFTASWDGTPVLSLTDAPDAPYTQYSFSVADDGSGSSTIQFDFAHVSFWWLDDVSVVPDTGGAPGIGGHHGHDTASPVQVHSAHSLR